MFIVCLLYTGLPAKHFTYVLSLPPHTALQVGCPDFTGEHCAVGGDTDRLAPDHKAST